MSGELEEKKWLVKRISYMLDGIRDTWQDEYYTFQDAQEGYGDLVISARNSTLALIAFIITATLALEADRGITLDQAEVSLVVEVGFAIAVFVGANLIFDWGDARLDQIRQGYEAGFARLSFVAARFTTGTIDLSHVSIDSLHLFVEYARILALVQYDGVLQGYKPLLKVVPRGTARNGIKERVKVLKIFVDLGYNGYSAIRSALLSSSMADDLKAMLSPYEERYLKEHPVPPSTS